MGLVANAVERCCFGSKHSYAARLRPGRKRQRPENASPPRTEPSHSQSTQGLLLLVFGIHGVRLLYWLASCNHFANDHTKYSMSEQCYFPPSKNPVMAYVYSQSTNNLHARTTSACALRIHRMNHTAKTQLFQPWDRHTPPHQHPQEHRPRTRNKTKYCSRQFPS